MNRLWTLFDSHSLLSFFLKNALVHAQSWVGIMLMKQPFYITGIEDLEVAKASAFGAAGAFFFLFLISILYLLNNGRYQLHELTSSTSTIVATNFPSLQQLPFQQSRGRGGIERFGDYRTVGTFTAGEHDDDDDADLHHETALT